MKKPFLILALAISSSAALAQNNTGWYVGAGLGQSNATFKNEDFAWNIANVAEGKDRSSTGWKLFGGYSFNKYLAVEAGYTDLGEAKYTYTGTGALTGLLSAQSKQAHTAWHVAGKASLPINDQFNIFGKLGITQNHVKQSASTTVMGVSMSGSDTKTRSDILLGVGAEYMLTKALGLRAEYETYGRFGNAFTVDSATGRTTVDLWSVNLTFKF